MIKMRKVQVLLFTLYLVSLVAIIAIGLITMWGSEVETASQQKNNLIAFYAAQAGLERAKVYSEHVVANDGDIWLPGSGTNDWYKELGDGWYKFHIVWAGGSNNRKGLESIGIAVGGAPNYPTLARRRLKTRVKEKGVDQQEEWRWREY